MSIDLNSPIIGTNAAFEWPRIANHPDNIGEYHDYVQELYRLCKLVGFDFRILYAQAHHETAGFTSTWWTERLNPAGIGITGDPAQNEASHTWTTGTDAARAHVIHMLAYTGMASTVARTVVEDYRRLDPRYDAVYAADYQATVRTLGDLGNGKWATDPQYAQKIAGVANRIFTGEQPMPITATECPIELRIVTKPAVNRPQLAMPDASFVTVHEVGNTSPGADEEMHAQFVHNGGGEHAVSFHFIVGPTKAIQLIYLNENAWHASDYYSGRGNRDSIAIETVQIGDFDRTLGHLAYLIAEIYRNPDRFAWRTDVGRLDDLAPALMKERTKQHNYWAPDQKNCPSQIRGRGLWLPLLDAVAAELKDAAPALPKYAAPILPEWWSEQAVIDLRNHREDDVLYKPLGARVAAIKETGAYAHPWLPEGKGKRTRAPIKAGEAVDLRYVVNHPRTGEQWGITKHGTWVAMKYFSPRYTVRHIS